jgi:tetratricopeptide (TPR) repeat protein
MTRIGISFVLAGLFAAAAAATPPNQRMAASVTAFGDPYAQSCFEAAKAGRGTHAAEEICTAALLADPLSEIDRAATLSNRGIIRLHRRDGTAALADFDAALTVRPKLAEAHVNRGAALILIGRTEEAVAVLTAALAMRPQEPHEAHFNRALAFERLDRLREAYEDYRAAQALRPDWPPASEALARFTVTPAAKQ